MAIYKIDILQASLKNMVTFWKFSFGPWKCHKNGILLHYMPKQQDIFGCLAKILGCRCLREAANLEIWPSRPQRGREGQSSKVGSLEKALGQPKIKARPPKRSRCICIQYNRWFCCIFGQRFMPSHHQSLSSSIGRASGSHAAAPAVIYASALANFVFCYKNT